MPTQARDEAIRSARRPRGSHRVKRGHVVLPRCSRSACRRRGRSQRGPDNHRDVHGCLQLLISQAISRQRLNCPCSCGPRRGGQQRGGGKARRHHPRGAQEFVSSTSSREYSVSAAAPPNASSGEQVGFVTRMVAARIEFLRVFGWWRCPGAGAEMVVDIVVDGFRSLFVCPVRNDWCTPRCLWKPENHSTV